MLDICVWYLILINVISCLFMGIDKRRAIKQKYRISEKCLFVCALLGGSIGSLLGMHLFHHKTKKKKFTVVIPLLLLIQFCILFLIFYIFDMRGI